MNWLKEVEHMRDYGHTWGPGIDDKEEPTEREIQQKKAWWKEYEEKKAKIRVAPSEEIKRAAEQLKSSLPDSPAISSGQVPYNWRESYSDRKLELAKKAARNLGYELLLKDREDVDKNQFMIAIEYYGYLPDYAGNIHCYDVRNIPSKEDCLKLFADFAEIGYWPTVWYQEHHIQLGDSADLRLEMIQWGFPLDHEKESMAVKIESAKNRVIAKSSGTERMIEEKVL